MLGEKKNPRCARRKLAASLGPFGHGPEFGGFLYPVSRLGFLLMKKWWGPFHTPRVEFKGHFYPGSVYRSIAVFSASAGEAATKL